MTDTIYKQCKIDGKYHYHDGTEEGLWVTKEDVTLTQEQIDAMSDEELEIANKKLYAYASGVLKDIDRFIRSYSIGDYLEQTAKSYQFMKDINDPHPWWRIRAALELVLFRVPFKIYKITTAMNIKIGDIPKDFICYEMSWNKKTLTFDTHQWYRVYKKTRKFTPEEQAEFDKKWEEKKEKERQARWKRNYERLGCKENWLDKKFKHKSGEIMTLLDLNPRNKKRPYLGYIEMPEGSKDSSGRYDVTVKYFKDCKIITKEKKNGKN